MKRLGVVKSKTKVPGHQDCSVCHPGSKGGRSLEERRAKKMEAQANGTGRTAADTTGKP